MGLQLGVLQLSKSNEMLVKEKLVQWFVSKSQMENIDTTLNYFESGYIDSFDVLMLIEFCESSFNVVLNEIHFEDRRFSSIDGLVDILNDLQVQ
ncbi:conserved hypothetical protein [Pseudoalteromonas sp. 3J6]|jgi:D-alanine--poly(phosphoribitol) ligase subunit 2|nr:conserved hypothetical protein [Pseudoalteromonas sp. 3J6]